MDPHDTAQLEALIRKVIRESKTEDEVWLWACEERKRSESKAQMWQSVKTSALGHLTWIVVVLTGTAIWEYVKRAAHHIK